MADEPTLYENDLDVFGWVAELQRLLAERGYPVADAAGEFRAETRNAVVAFQQANGCDPDGIVGDQTWSMLYGREREPEGIRNEPYGNTREGGVDGGGEVPQEVVSLGLPESFDQWSDEQKTAYLSAEDSIEIDAESAEAVEVLAINETGGEGEALA